MGWWAFPVRALSAVTWWLRRALWLLRPAAEWDELTGLPNRRASLRHAQRIVRRAIRDGSGLAVILVDVDRFGGLLREAGDDAGDAALRAVTRAIQQSLRHLDFVGRVGTDEFLVILHGTPEEGAWAAAHRMGERVGSVPVAVAGGHFTVSVSMGIAMRDGERDPLMLLRRADLALQAAKCQGPSRIRIGHRLPQPDGA